MTNKNYKYLIQLYSKVEDYLTKNNPPVEELPEIIVSFCVVVERILKIGLHNENPVLLFENNKIENNNALVAVVKEKEEDIETIRIGETLARHKLMFEKDFSDDEYQALLDIYKKRNGFIHGYKPDDKILSDAEITITKMGTIWEKISKKAVGLFGKRMIKARKPQKKYTEEELEKILTNELMEEVRKKIERRGYSYYGSYSAFDLDRVDYARGALYSFSPFGEEKCPRCGSYSFSREDRNYEPISIRSTFSDLYKCKKCNLELTEKEYEMAKKIKGQ